MIQGQKYRVITTPIHGVWNKPREMVMAFVDKSDDEFMFSARPKAGTTRLKKKHLAAVYEVHPDTPIMLPRIYRPETRVL